MPPLLWVLIKAAFALFFLWAGAELLVRGASSLARRVGISELAVGLTVVAFGTSAPELVVSLRAATAGSSDIAIGNVVGSNICNIALILGVAALVRPALVQAKVFRVDAPLLVAVSLALTLLLATGGMGRPAGTLLVGGLLLYIGITFRQARREGAAVREEFREGVPPARGRSALDGLWVVLGLGALIAGGDLFVQSAIVMANAMGVSEAAIGLTVVAVGTSLPELATSVVAAARGQGDIAVGNVVGSNLFNVLGILGITAIVTPMSRGGIGGVDVGMMLALSIVLLPIVRTGFVVSRREGALLLASYVAYVVWRLS